MYTQAIGFERHGILAAAYLATPSQGTLQYISGDNAITDGLVEVGEVHDAGDVNALEVRNTSDYHVFMMDGDILEGAKQTRVLNTSVFLAPRSRTIIPVSCVEQGRWRYTSRGFKGSKHTAPRSTRALKSQSVMYSLRTTKEHRADQGKVWDDVRAFDNHFSVDSPTMSLSDTYEKLESSIDALVASFGGQAEANGFALFVNGGLLNVDVFNRRDICAEYLPKVLRAAALEAVYLEEKADIDEAKLRYEAVDFLDRIGRMEHERHPAVALGSELRFDGEEATGFRLEYDELLVHFTALKLGENGE